MTQDRLKLAVFIDFDNIEIGVRNTLGRSFDISAVLEAIKERGEIVTKVAYGDWKRSGDYGRMMGQHAIHMVQRNPTPGGDKNGADINLALDALEMAFTRDHINAFVIVGGDSDFITLVEKLKQYDKKVLVVGGRAFTSVILQKNCHEFIAYENLVRPSRKPAGRARSVSDTEIGRAVPLVRRALKILTDREVSPQLGLLKSTLLQLDSTFSERDYGATTFRDFIEKLARTGVVSLKHEDRSIFVELQSDDSSETGDGSEDGSAKAPAGEARRTQPRPPEVAGNGARVDEGVERIRSAFEKADRPSKWPMYLRGFKQFVKAAEPDFDEKAFGFTSWLDVARHVQKAGVVRLERNRQGVVRIFPGEKLPDSEPLPSSEDASVPQAEEAVEPAESPTAEREASAERSGDAALEEEAAEAPASEQKTVRKKAVRKTTKKAKTARKTAKKAVKKKATKAAAGGDASED